MEEDVLRNPYCPASLDWLMIAAPVLYAAAGGVVDRFVGPTLSRSVVLPGICVGVTILGVVLARQRDHRRFDRVADMLTHSDPRERWRAVRASFDIARASLVVRAVTLLCGAKWSLRDDQAARNHAALQLLRASVEPADRPRVDALIAIAPPGESDPAATDLATYDRFHRETHRLLREYERRARQARRG